MKILTIGSDRKLFEKNSAVKERVLEYGTLFEELHVIIFSLDGHSLKRQRISNNIWLYPTNSKSRWLYIVDALRIGKTIQDIDVVTTQDPFESGFVGQKLSKTLSARLHVQVHTDFLNPYFAKHSILNRIRVRIAHFVIPKAHCIRVVSERVSQSIKDRFNLSFEVAVLPIFVPVAEIRDSKPEEDIRKKYSQFDFLILISARLESEKNIQLAINAMEKVVKRRPKVGLLIIGEGKERRELENQVIKSHLQENVLFLGWQEDFVSYYKGVDLLLVTSDYEGYGMATIEALASGLSVLSTDVGIAKEAGAIIMDREKVSESIEECIEQGRKKVTLKHYNYKGKEEYLQAYRENLELCQAVNRR